MKKECRRCHNILSINNFHKAKNNRDGYNYICKKCRSKQEKDRYANNRDRILNNVRVYRDKIRPEIKRRAKIKYRDNSEYRISMLEYQRIYREENKIKTLEYAKKYREKNRELVNKKIRDYRQTKKGKFSARQHWRSEKGKFKTRQQYHKRRCQKKEAGGSYSLEEWENLKKKFNYTCPMCGKSEPEIKLTEDHKIPLNKGGTNWISNIQPLCRNCNSKKGDRIITIPLPDEVNI